MTMSQKYTKSLKTIIYRSTFDVDEPKANHSRKKTRVVMHRRSIHQMDDEKFEDNVKLLIDASNSLRSSTLSFGSTKSLKSKGKHPKWTRSFRSWSGGTGLGSRDFSSWRVARPILCVSASNAMSEKSSRMRSTRSL